MRSINSKRSVESDLQGRGACVLLRVDMDIPSRSGVPRICPHVRYARHRAVELAMLRSKFTQNDSRQPFPYVPEQRTPAMTSSRVGIDFMGDPAVGELVGRVETGTGLLYKLDEWRTVLGS